MPGNLALSQEKFEEDLDKQTICLAKNIYYEARNQPVAAMVAVSQVVLNRVKDPRYPDTICGVIYQGKYWKKHIVRNKCQFSWFCDGKSDNPKNKEWWDASKHVAKYVINPDKPIFDLTGGAQYYHYSKMKKFPKWVHIKRKTVQIGDHIFYAWK